MPTTPNREAISGTGLQHSGTDGTGRLESALSKTLDLPDEVWCRLRSETDHELRAALICLLTAALASKGTAAIIGEAEGGWFWLPPWSLWQPWAIEGLEGAAKGMESKVTSVLDPFAVDL
jgi:hypothetical protein